MTDPSPANADRPAVALEQLGQEFRLLRSDLIDRGVPEDLIKECESSFHAAERALDSMVRVAVFGAMSSGKSSLLNAVLGVDYLPGTEGRTTQTIVVIRATKEAPTEVGTKTFLNWDQYERCVRGNLAIVMPDQLQSIEIDREGAFIEPIRDGLKQRGSAVQNDLATADSLAQLGALLDGFDPPLFASDKARVEPINSVTEFKDLSDPAQVTSQRALLASLAFHVRLPEGWDLPGLDGIELVDLPGSGSGNIKDGVLFSTALPEIETVLFCATHPKDQAAANQIIEFRDALRTRLNIDSSSIADRVIVVATQADTRLLSKAEEALSQTDGSIDDKVWVASSLDQWVELNSALAENRQLPLFVSAYGASRPEVGQSNRDIVRASMARSSDVRLTRVLEGLSDGSGLGRIRHAVFEHTLERGQKRLSERRSATLMDLRGALLATANSMPRLTVEHPPSISELAESAYERFKTIERRLKTGSLQLETVAQAENSAIRTIYSWPVWNTLVTRLGPNGLPNQSAPLGGDTTPNKATDSRLDANTSDDNSTAIILEKMIEDLAPDIRATNNAHFASMSDLKDFWVNEMKTIIQHSSDQIRRDMGREVNVLAHESVAEAETAMNLLSNLGTVDPENAERVRQYLHFVSQIPQGLNFPDIAARVDTKYLVDQTLEQGFPLNSRAEELPWRQPPDTDNDTRSYRNDHLVAVARVRYALAEAGQLAVRHHNRHLQERFSNEIRQIEKRLTPLLQNVRSALGTLPVEDISNDPLRYRIRQQVGQLDEMVKSDGTTNRLGGSEG